MEARGTDSDPSDSKTNKIKERFSIKSPVKIYGKNEEHYVKWWLEIFLSELVGTFFLMYFGCLSPFLYNEKQKVSRTTSIEFEQTTVLRYGLNWGFVVSSIITAIGHISKAHLNPAVTLCACLLGHISLSTAVVYFVSEIVGCVLGVYGAKISIPASWYARYNEQARCGLCCTCLHPLLSLPQALFLEFMATSLLVYVVCSVWDWRNEKWNDSTAIKFALLVAMLSMTLGPITGASMNPARSFGPAFVNWRWTDHWVYWLSPLSGSAFTTLFYRYVHRMKITEAKDSYRNIL